MSQQKNSNKTTKETSIIPIVHAEETENTEETPEPEDPKPKIVEECGETTACKPLKHHLEECSRRVEEGGTDETCAEEFLHFMHCVDHCAAPKVFAALK